MVFSFAYAPENNRKLMLTLQFTIYTKNILEIIENYNKIFKHIQKIKIYIQIVQKKVNKNNDFSGGFASYNSVEFVFYDKIYSDSIVIKQIIAHELLHLYFPAISSKYGIFFHIRSRK
jgi:hypothetical protein